MARRGWGGSIATAVGVAAGTGAAQLGFGYGLGVIDWAPADATAGTTAWVAGLIWASWIAATSTVAGAVCAQRLRDRAPTPHAGPGDTTVAEPDDRTANAPRPVADDTTATGSGDGVLRHVALAVAAGLGALVTVLLVAVPARTAVAADTDSPRNVAAVYAAVGVLVGVLTAVWALRSRAAANNVIATVGWLWLLAGVAVVDGVLAGRGLTSAQLGIWQLSADDGQFWIRDHLYWPGALLSLGSALLIGALAARGGARHADRRVGAAASGAAGPLLVATAYFLAVPRLTAISPEQLSAHLIAPYAVIVGVGGSVLVAALAQRAARRAASHGSVRVPRQRTGEPADLPGDPSPAGQHDAAETDTGATSTVPDPAGPDTGAITPTSDPAGEPDAGGATPARAAVRAGARTAAATGRPSRSRKPAADAGSPPTGSGPAGPGPAGAAGRPAAAGPGGTGSAGAPARVAAPVGDPAAPPPGEAPTTVSGDGPTTVPGDGPASASVPGGQAATDADPEQPPPGGRRPRSGRRTR
ncbi:hypothetical protein GA0070606_3192 [Micromonospora citrea]|uniref:Uncharacterized protein n=1 Tax=Micromonospora citrea TaxID=47855 RepID=A0A1C6V1C6_9ACTN|nr:hypothetical protein GA0070606_3192 [Micromonospora citrea]